MEPVAPNLESLAAAYATIRARFAKSVRPLYSKRAGARLEHEASCVLLRVGRHRFLVTAAHVTDVVAKGADLLIGGEKEVAPLVSTWLFTSNVPPGGREADTIDLAYYLLPDEFADQLGNVTWVEPRDLAPNDYAAMPKLYAAMGFPNSKNAGINRRTGLIHPELRVYFGRASSAGHENLGFSESTHVVMPYRKRGIANPKGHRSSPLNTRGMSGGPVVCISAAELVQPEDQRSPKIVGIIIERVRERQILVATRISLLQAMMQDAIPELALAFEQNRRVAFTVTPAEPNVQNLFRSTL